MEHDEMYKYGHKYSSEPCYKILGFLIAVFRFWKSLREAIHEGPTSSFRAVAMQIGCIIRGLIGKQGTDLEDDKHKLVCFEECAFPLNQNTIRLMQMVNRKRSTQVPTCS